MGIEEQISTNLEHDEEIIKKLTQSNEFTPLNKTSFNDQQLLEYLLKQLQVKYKGKSLIITLTGGPASGKSSLRDEIISKLSQQRAACDYVATDDFNLYSRVERNKKISEGVSPLDVKDFAYLSKVVEAVRLGNSINAPRYDDFTGDAMVVGNENFPHLIPSGLDYFIIEGDFQPIENPDIKIYLHVPTDIRRNNRVIRDLQKRSGYGDAEAIKKSFDGRLESQYYPYTLPNAETADLLIVTSTIEAPSNYKYPYQYSYMIYKHN